MLLPLIDAAHQHLNSWALGPVLQSLDRFLDDPDFRALLISKPKTFVRPQGLYSLPVTVKTFLTQCLAQDHSCRTAQELRCLRLAKPSFARRTNK